MANEGIMIVGKSKSKLGNDLQVIKSDRILEMVARELNLTTSYFLPGRILNSEQWKNCIIRIEWLDNPSSVDFINLNLNLLQKHLLKRLHRLQHWRTNNNSNFHKIIKSNKTNININTNSQHKSQDLYLAVLIVQKRVLYKTMLQVQQSQHIFHHFRVNQILILLH